MSLGGECLGEARTTLSSEACRRERRGERVVNDGCRVSGDTDGDSSDTTPKRYDPFCSMECVPDRTAGKAFDKQALCGEKPLRPKVLRSHTLTQEVEGLQKAKAQLTERIEPQEGSSSPSSAPSVPKDFQADLEDADSGAVTEWVRRFLEHEESVKGVPPRMVSEACKTIMGDGNQVLDLKEVKGCYFGVLQEVRRLLDERICTVQDDLARLEQELLILDEVIAICFEKMDVAGDGEVTSERFVACVCGEGEGDPSVIAVSPEDVEVLFKQMSKGKQVITQEKFKEEVTHGCLQILRANFDLRQSMKKRYRDHWF